MVRGVDTTTVGPKVLGLLPENKVTAVSYIRMTGPMSYLRRKGYPVDWMTYTAARELARQHAGISVYDVFVFPRAGDAYGKLCLLFEKLAKAGKCVIWETDDDYTNQYRQVIDADTIAPMRMATALTVSTLHLKKRCGEYTDKPVYLLQNTIDIEFWKQASGRRELAGVTVGLVGTHTHYDDWIIVKDALYQIARDYPEVRFVVGGFLPDYLEDLPGLTFIPPAPYPKYPHMVRQVDIGLCPLVGDDEFNKSKSAVKALEYWAGGAVPIASRCSVYEPVIQEGKTGFLCDNSTSAWYERIGTLIEDRVCRKTMQVAGWRWLRGKRSMAVNCQFWWDTYQDVFNRYGGKK